jgi:hypothetical protein
MGPQSGGKKLSPYGQLNRPPTFGGGNGKLSLGLNVEVRNEFNLFAKKPGSNGIADSNGGSNNNGNGGNSGNGGRGGRPRKNGRKPKDDDSGSYFQLKGRTSIPVEWSSGIHSGLLYNNRQAGCDTFSPTYIAHGQMFPGNKNGQTLESFVAGFIDNEVFQLYKDTVASNNTIAATRNFKMKEFLGYVHTVIHCVQVYYSIDSILTLHTNEELENSGISILRERVTAESASEFSRLEFELRKHSLPPRVASYIRFMYQGFTASSEANSPIFKLSYKNIWLEGEDDSCVEGSIESGIITKAIQSLQDPKFSDIRTIYRQVIPQHNLKLEPSVNVPIESLDYLTMWHNMTVWYCNPSMAEQIGITTCNVVDSTTKFHYFTLKDDLDASFLALKTVFKSQQYSCGLWKPNGSLHNPSPTNYVTVSRLKDSSYTNSMNDELTSACGICQIPVYDTARTVISTSIRPGPGFRRTMSCTEENVSLAVQTTVRYLFELNTDGTTLSTAGSSY